MVHYPKKVHELPTTPYFAILTERSATGGYNEPVDVWDITTYDDEEDWRVINQNAKQRRYEFSITIEYIDKLITTQNFKCALSGIDISTSVQNHTASLDRIDSSKGYVEGNVQWIHKELNIIKHIHSNESFIKWCKLVSEYNK